MSKFDHLVEPLENGRHRKFSHLVLAEIEPHYGSYIFTIHGHKGSALTGPDDAAQIFGEQLDKGFAYVVDDYLDILN